MTPEEIQRLRQDVERILQWPRETRSDEETRRLIERRALLHHELFALVDNAERTGRNLTSEEQGLFNTMQDEFDRLGGEVPAPR